MGPMAGVAAMPLTRDAVKPATSRVALSRGRLNEQRSEPQGRATDALASGKMERILVRSAWGQKEYAIAKAEGMSVPDVRTITKHPPAEWAELRDKIRDQIVQTAYEKIQMSLKHVTEAKAVKASNAANATTAAILLDKARVMEGLPSSIVGDIEVDVAKLLQPELLRLLIEQKGGMAALKPEHRALAERLGLA